jgi:hypothetical protein
MKVFNYHVCYSELNEELIDASLQLRIPTIYSTQAGLDNRTRIIPQFPDCKKEKG